MHDAQKLLQRTLRNEIRRNTCVLTTVVDELPAIRPRTEDAFVCVRPRAYFSEALLRTFG